MLGTALIIKMPKNIDIVNSLLLMRLKIPIRKITIPILQWTRQLHEYNRWYNLYFEDMASFEEMASFDYMADNTAELDFVVEMATDLDTAAD